MRYREGIRRPRPAPHPRAPRPLVERAPTQIGLFGKLIVEHDQVSKLEDQFFVYQ